MPFSEGYLNLVREIAAVELETLSLEDALRWLLPKTLAIHGANSAAVSLVGFSSDASRPDDNAPVRSFTAPKQEGALSAIPAKSLHMLGRPAVLADLRELTYEVLEGGVDDPILPLEANQRCLLVRSRLRDAIVWLRLHGPMDRMPGKDDARAGEWAQGLDAAVRLVRRFTDPPPRGTVQERRQGFYQRVLRMQHREPWKDLQEVCRAWMETSGASWCWLWLYNSISKEFELSAYASDGSGDMPRSPREVLPGGTSAAAYCIRRREPVFVYDVSRWGGEIDGQAYSVTFAQELRALGSPAFDIIPLLAADEVEDAEPLADRQGVRGIITLHYRDPSKRQPQPASSHIIMGRMTALRAHTSRTSVQAEVLDELNHLAQKHLTKIHQRQVTVRRDYLNEVIELIKRHIHVNCVSIFYRREHEPAIECIATTGLIDSEGRIFGPDDKLSEVVYRAGENWTGQCFAQGKPILEPAVGAAGDHKHRYADALNGKPVVSGMILQFPIPNTSGANDQSQSLGVIRCSEHDSPLFPGQARGFDPVDVRLVRFIARQLAPVLETIAGRIRRESEISVIKHDLYTPLAMIRDITARIDRDWKNKKEVREYDIRNLAFSERTASNLVDRLSVDLSKPLEIHPQPTKLVGNIIARLKNMLSEYAQAENKMQIQFDDIDERIPMLNIDRELIERAIYNILVNAVKYGAPHTAIQLGARVSQGGFYLDISNFGIGIQDDEKGHIFEPEYRSPRARQFGHGVGLGLTIAQKALAAHGGSVAVTSLRDPTTLSLFFPRALVARRTS